MNSEQTLSCVRLSLMQLFNLHAMILCKYK